MITKLSTRFMALRYCLTCKAYYLYATLILPKCIGNQCLLQNNIYYIQSKV